VLIDDWQEAPEILGAVKRAVDADVAKATADYSLLADLSIIRRVPAWRNKGLHRLNRSPKIHIADPGRAARRPNVDVTALKTAEHRTEVFHLRNRDRN